MLQLFYSNPNRPFYVREITRKIDEQINSVRRELANLLSIGIISSDSKDNKLYYEVSQGYEYYDPLSAIFGGGVVKAVAAAPSVEVPNQDFKALGMVDLAIYTGQFTRDESSGVDVLIVGDVNKTKLEHYMADLEQQENKELRYVLMSLDEFRYRQQVNDRFLSLVLESKLQVLVDTHNVINPAKPKKAKATKEKEEEV